MIQKAFALWHDDMHHVKTNQHRLWGEKLFIYLNGDGRIVVLTWNKEEKSQVFCS